VKPPEYKNLIGSDHVDRIRYMSNIKNFIGSLYRESCFSPVMVGPGLRVRKTMMSSLNYIFLFDENPRKPIIACCTVSDQGFVQQGFLIAVNGDQQSFYQGEFFNQTHYNLINTHFPCIKDGQGQYFYNDGRLFVGEFAMNFRHGQGKMEWPTKNLSYTGQYVKGLKHGHGFIRYSDEYYAGSFVAGKKHGKGLYVYADGSHYYGSFENDEKHGKGRLFFAKHKKYVWVECMWFHNKPSHEKVIRTIHGCVCDQDGVPLPSLPDYLLHLLHQPETTFQDVIVSFN